MEGDGFPDGRLASGYMLMAIVSGWQFLNSVVGWRLVQGELTTWAIYYVQIAPFRDYRFFHSPFHDPVELDKTDTFPDSTITIF